MVGWAGHPNDIFQADTRLITIFLSNLDLVLPKVLLSKKAFPSSEEDNMWFFVVMCGK